VATADLSAKRRVNSIPINVLKLIMGGTEVSAS